MLKDYILYIKKSKTVTMKNVSFAFASVEWKQKSFTACFAIYIIRMPTIKVFIRRLKVRFKRKFDNKKSKSNRHIFVERPAVIIFTSIISLMHLNKC